MEDTSQPEERGEVTRLLQRVGEGDGSAAQELLEHLYRELHAMAAAKMRSVPGQTLQPTALVNEAWLRLIPFPQDGSKGNGYRSREHFLGVASKAMRSALVDHARQRSSVKRGRDWSRVPLDVALERVGARGVDILSLNDALERLAADEPRQARIVELRFFGGLTLEEIASAIGVSRATVDRDWHLARTWLRVELRGDTI